MASIIVTYENSPLVFPPERSPPPDLHRTEKTLRAFCAASTEINNRRPRGIPRFMTHLIRDTEKRKRGPRNIDQNVFEHAFILQGSNSSDDSSFTG